MKVENLSEEISPTVVELSHDRINQDALNPADSSSQDRRQVKAQSLFLSISEGSDFDKVWE